MQQSEIDGVPVLWEDAPGPWTASLIFGVGTRHETFRTVGVTHLVEHLVMSALPKNPLDRNASVAIDTTAFYASGRVGSVVEFLGDVCRAISDPPLVRTATEAGVLAAEGGSVEHPAICVSLGARYGLTGPGLAGTDGPGPDTLQEGHVVEHLGRHFVRENAVLVTTGEPPPHLRLPLPEGTRPPLANVRQTPLILPGRLSWDAPITSLSVAVEGSNAWAAIMRILVERITDDIRHGRGLAYDIDWSGVWLDQATSVFAIWADGRDGQQAAIADALWRAFRTMATAAPTAEELAHDLAGLDESLADSRQTLDRLEYNGWRLLTGKPLRQPAELRGELAALDPGLMSELVAASLPTVLAHVSDGSTAELEGLQDRNHEPQRDASVQGRTFSRRMVSLAPRRLQVAVGEEGVTLWLSDDVSTVSWGDIVGLGVDQGRREIVAADGRMIPIFARDLRNGDDLVALIDARVPDGLRFQASSD